MLLIFSVIEFSKCPHELDSCVALENIVRAVTSVIFSSEICYQVHFIAWISIMREPRSSSKSCVEIVDRITIGLIIPSEIGVITNENMVGYRVSRIIAFHEAQNCVWISCHQLFTEGNSYPETVTGVPLGVVKIFQDYFEVYVLTLVSI